MERQEQDKKPMQKPFLAKGGTLASNGAAVKKLQELKKKREEFLHNKGKAGMDELKSFPRSKKTGLFSDQQAVTDYASENRGRPITTKQTDKGSPTSRENSIESGTSKRKYKPAVKKSLKAFIAMCQKLIDQKKFQQCKEITEKAIKNKLYGEIPQDAKLYMHCGIANMNVGYLIIAEQMISKCLHFPEYVA